MKSKKHIESVRVRVIPDDSPDTSYLKQDGFEDRLAQYNASEFHFIGIRVEARININGLLQTISSGGLWGIEDDSDQGFLDETAQEELRELKGQLSALGFTERQLDGIELED